MNALQLASAQDSDILADFLAFVDSQPANKSYHFYDSSNCAFAQYLESKGLTDFSVGLDEFSFYAAGPYGSEVCRRRLLPALIRQGNVLMKNPSMYGSLFSLVSDQHSFGGLSKRLHKAMGVPFPKRPSISDWIHSVVAGLRPVSSPALLPAPVRG